MARVIGNRAMNKAISPLPEVQDAVEDVADDIKAKAEALLAPHRKTGEHHITKKKNLDEKYGFLDYEVALEGPAAESVEFGHVDKKSGRPVDGLHIIKRASGLI